jgi:hypothetical protein
VQDIFAAAAQCLLGLLGSHLYHSSVVQDQSCVRIRTGNVSANPTGGYGYFSTLAKKTFFSNRQENFSLFADKLRIAKIIIFQILPQLVFAAGFKQVQRISSIFVICGEVSSGTLN